MTSWCVVVLHVIYVIVTECVVTICHTFVTYCETLLVVLLCLVQIVTDCVVTICQTFAIYSEVLLLLLAILCCGQWRHSLDWNRKLVVFLATINVLLRLALPHVTFDVQCVCICERWGLHSQGSRRAEEHEALHEEHGILSQNGYDKVGSMHDRLVLCFSFVSTQYFTQRVRQEPHKDSQNCHKRSHKRSHKDFGKTTEAAELRQVQTRTRIAIYSALR